MLFHDYTMRADGIIASHRQHGTRDLEPRAVLAFAQIVRQVHFEGAVHPLAPGITLRWDRSADEAMATFYAEDEMLTTSALASAEESSVFAELSKLTSTRRSKSLQIERPAIVSIPWPAQNRDAMMLVADMETCLAAAFFDRELVRSILASELAYNRPADSPAGRRKKLKPCPRCGAQLGARERRKHKCK